MTREAVPLTVPDVGTFARALGRSLATRRYGGNERATRLVGVPGHSCRGQSKYARYPKGLDSAQCDARYGRIQEQSDLVNNIVPQCWRYWHAWL